MTTRHPGEIARAEQQHTACQRMLDVYLGLVREAVEQVGDEPVRVWASIARTIIDDRTLDEVGEEVAALAGVFAAVVELHQRREVAA